MNDVPVIVLPPEPSPRGLTANAPTQTLRDHFLAFLSMNNPSGLDRELIDHIPSKSVGELMLLVSSKDWLRVDDFKRQARKLHKTSNGVIIHMHCLDLIARLFGYAKWTEASALAIDDRILNRRADRSSINMKIFVTPTNTEG